jgi:NADH-quinone oxidoreductase subunit L
MAAGHDAHDDHGHDAHGHDDHDDHDAHGSGGDFWVVPPLVIGLIVGIVLVVLFGLDSGAAAYLH